MARNDFVGLAADTRFDVAETLAQLGLEPLATLAELDRTETLRPENENDRTDR
jgi:hypothetical protein